MMAKVSKEEIDAKFPEKWPKKTATGPKMNYVDSSLAFPKSGKKQKKGKK